MDGIFLWERTHKQRKTAINEAAQKNSLSGSECRERAQFYQAVANKEIHRARVERIPSPLRMAGRSSTDLTDRSKCWEVSQRLEGLGRGGPTVTRDALDAFLGMVGIFAAAVNTPIATTSNRPPDCVLSPEHANGFPESQAVGECQDLCAITAASTTYARSQPLSPPRVRLRVATHPPRTPNQYSKR